MLGLVIGGGIAIGFALGLIGGGGGIFAVPLLVFGLSLPVHEAVGVSLAAVGATTLFGAVERYRRGETDVRTGMIFAVAGMIGAPLGSRLSLILPGWVLLLLFSILMVVVAVRMWQTSWRTAVQVNSGRFVGDRDEHGRPVLGQRWIAMLSAIGLATGILSGMLGVGGGFVIVPALVLIGGLSIHCAIATSLMVIFLISISGVTSYVLGGGAISWSLTSLFAVGGVVGMYVGSQLSSRLSGPSLQRIFAVAIVVVASLMIVRSVA